MERQTRTPPLRGQSRRAWRGCWLLASTALSAVLAHPAPSRAQNLPPNTTPQGGVVVGGSASISQAPGSTTINQSSNRAAIDWQTFNVGGNAKVQFVQPSSSAITLNRVVTPSPSVIAGHITANGQIVLINQSGVVFTKGAEVTAQSVIVSTSNISNSDFMAGKLNFSGAPRPGARIVNDGVITARQAGLVGLVAPQVANNGVISARLGQVVLAGADAFTLDLYGDKLVSLDVTKAVREVDLDGKTVPALVTNKGLILADGGKITLTAADADALVSQLLQVGGTLQADSTAGKSGTISLQAVGGDINIAGNLLARGTVAGSGGGNVEAVATGKVAVASNAVIDASGQAGGGTIALGTNLQRAAEGAGDTAAPRAASVSIASGAEIKADATSRGNGGKVTLLSSKETDFAGTISTTGGTLGGNGGIVEISSDGVISLGGTVIDTAINGQAGEILLDPQTLIVTGSSATNAGKHSTGAGTHTSTTFGTDNGATSFVDSADLSSLQGTIILEASKLLSVDSAINNSSASLLELTSGQDLTISAGISVAGALDINAAGTLDVGAALNASTITLADTGGAGVIDINGVITGTELVVNAGGAVTEGAGGGIAVASLTTGTGSIAGNALLGSTLNTISTLGNFLTQGTLDLADSTALLQTGTATGADITLAAAGLSLDGDITATNLLALASTAGVTQASGGVLSAKTLTTGTGSITGDASLTGTANNIGTLGAFGATGTLALADNTGLNVTGGVNAEDITIAANGVLGLDGAVTAASGGNIALAAKGIAVNGGSLAAPSGTISIAPFGNGTLDVGGSTAGGLILSSALLAALDSSASVLNFGSAAGHLASLVELEGNVSLQPTLAVDSSGRVVQTGTLTGQAISLTAASLALNGMVNATSLNLAASSAVSETGGALKVSTLSGSGTASGNIFLTGPNTIGTLAGLSAAGDIAIVNTGTMTLGGAVSAGESLALVTDGLLEGTGGSLSASTIALAPFNDGAVDLGGSSVSGLQLSQALVNALDPAATIVIGAVNGFSANSIVTEGAVSFANALLSLSSTGNITQGASAGLAVATLAGTGSDILLGGNNSINVLNGLSAMGTINVQDQNSLAVDGGLSAAAITLAADGLDLASQISATGLAVLDSSGGLSQSAGALHVGTLSGSVASGANLNGTLNNIATLAAFTAGGAFNLADQRALTQTGTLSGQDVSLTGTSLTLDGTVDATALDLTASGGISQAGTGVLNVSTLDGIGTPSGAVLLGGTGNNIGTLIALAAGQNILLDSSGATAIIGQISAGTDVTLQGGGFAESGDGAITARTLTTGAGSLTGGLALGGTNSIGTLGVLNAGGDVLLADTSPLAIAGLVSTPGTLSLTSPGAVTEAAGGTLNVGELTSGAGSIGGALSLANANNIGTLGALDAAGNILIGNTGTTTLGGAVTAGGTLALATNGLLEGAGGSLSASTIALAPFTGGVIDLGGGSVSGLQLAQSLIGALDPAATVILGEAGGHNAHSIVTEGSVSFANAVAMLDSTGGISEAGTLSGTTLDLNGANLALDGVVNASLLNLSASSGISQASTGALNASTLAGVGSVAGNIALGGANSIGVLNGLSATGNINVQDSANLSVDGAVRAGNSLALSASNLTLTNTLSGADISLAADSITDNGGAVRAPGGTVSIAPRTSGRLVDLGGDAAGLDISNTLLGDITAAALDISTQGGIVADGSVSISMPLLSLSGHGITFAGTLDVPGTLALSSSAGVTSTSAGHLTAGTLLTGGAVTGNVDLSQGSNHISSLGAITLDGGTLTLTDATALAVDGPLSAAAVSLTAAGLNIASQINASGTVVLDSVSTINQTGAITAQGVSLVGDSLLLNGPVNATLLGLAASHGVSETGGMLNVATLSGNIAGNAVLNGAANNIGTLENFADHGSLFLTDAAALTQAGALSANNAAISAAGLDFTGNVATPGTLALASTNGISQSQSGGTLNVGVLSSIGTIGGNVDLTRGGDVIPSVRDFAATGTIQLASSSAIAETGALSGNAISLTASSFALDGMVSAANALQLDGGGVSEGTGAAIDAALLTTGGGSLSGGADLNSGRNRITGLGGFTASGGLTLADGAGLAISGPVSLGGTLALADSGDITQTGGSIIAAALTSDGGTVGGNAVFGQSGNAIPVLGPFTARGNLLLNTGDALAVTGNINAGGVLSLFSGGAIDQTGGLIATPRLNASGTSIDLGNTDIGLLGNVSASGDVSIANAGGLSGSLTAQDATLGSNGGFVSSGDARLSNGVYISAAGPVNQTGGTISAQTATVTASSITLSGATDVNAALGLRASGDIVHEAGSLNAGTLTGTAGQLAEFGAATDIGTLGSFLMRGGTFMLDNDAPLTLDGPLVANVASITATGTLTLEGSADGGLFLSGSTLSNITTAPRTGVDSVLAVTGGNPMLLQNGTFFVDSGPNLASYLGNASPFAGLFLSLASSGSIALATAPGILNAPNTDLVLAAGAAGIATGNVDVLHLEVLSAQSVDMTGFIANVTGPTAAGNGSAFPFPQPGFRFNTCPIGSVNCTLLPIEGLPQANPLENFDISPRRHRKLDKNVVLPGVAARDF